MSGVNETLVREYFELHNFYVRQHRKYISSNVRTEEEADFYIINPRTPDTKSDLPFVLGSEHLRKLSSALVVVKGWHTETFGPAMLSTTPEMFRFAESSALKEATSVYGGSAPATLMVIPVLPANPELKEESIRLLREKGISGVILFRTILSDLIQNIEINRNYQKSDVLQLIRILKTYDFLKEQQMELFKPVKKRKKTSVKPVQAG
ncbi:MAG: hypothetical protein JWM04_1918 [Verrucomicrobiales bacterium]|nr:hypothetical protein [Verrucomicrobiales bacterium]